jgi:hypothetical protein
VSSTVIIVDVIAVNPLHNSRSDLVLMAHHVTASWKEHLCYMKGCVSKLLEIFLPTKPAY